MNILPSLVYYERYPRFLHTLLLADHSALYKQALSLLMPYPSFAIYDLFCFHTRTPCTSWITFHPRLDMFSLKKSCICRNHAVSNTLRPPLTPFCVSVIPIQRTLPTGWPLTHSHLRQPKAPSRYWLHVCRASIALSNILCQDLPTIETPSCALPPLAATHSFSLPLYTMIFLFHSTRQEAVVVQWSAHPIR